MARSHHQILQIAFKKRAFNIFDELIFATSKQFVF